MVAEKPSIAQALADALGKDVKKGGPPKLPVYTYTGNFMNSKAYFK
jgi:hypothetical protein